MARVKASQGSPGRTREANDDDGDGKVDELGCDAVWAGLAEATRDADGAVGGSLEPGEHAAIATAEPRISASRGAETSRDM
jgi:hypothetical protein